MKICPSCGTQNDDSNQFCSNCGSVISSKSTCPYCKKEINPADVYCPSCGKSLKEKSNKEPKKKLSKLKKSLIGIASFVVILAIAYLCLFFYGKFYIEKNFTFRYSEDGSIQLIDKGDMPELSFSNMTICASIDENTNAPINSVNEFNIGTRKIYATIHISGAFIGDTFKFIWKYADTKETIIEYKNYYLDSGRYFEGYEKNYIALPETQPLTNCKIFGEPGDYIVEFYHNDVLIDSVTFSMLKTATVFSGHVISNLIDTKTLSPLKSKDSYGYSTEELFSAINITGFVEKDDNFRFTLKDIASGSIIKENQANYSDITQDDLLNQYIYFYITGPYSDKEIYLNTGDYIVEFYHNGSLISQAQFSIGAPGVSFGDLETGKSYNTEDDSVIDPTDSFILGNKFICSSIKVEGASMTDKWKFIWQTADKEKIIREFEDYYYPDQGEEYFNGYQSLNLYMPEGASIEGVDIFGYSGNYLVEYYHNDDLIGSREFKVIDTGERFGELVMCESVDTDDSPVKTRDEFAYGIDNLCATIEIIGADLSDDLRFLWKDSDGNILRDMNFKYSDNWTKQGDKYNGYFAILIGLGQDSKLEDHDILGKEGTYSVQFYHNGYLISTKSFKIIKK